MLVFYAAISHYLRHSDAVANKHYDFSVIEKAARARTVMCSLTAGGKVIVILFEINNL